MAEPRTTGADHAAPKAPAFDPDVDRGPAPSPCVQICRMDARGAYCIGCQRTLAEIAAWRGMDESEKCAIWRRLVCHRSEK